MTLSNSISHSVTSWFTSMRKMLWNSFIFSSTKKFSKLIMLCYGFREIIRIIKIFKVTINYEQNLGWLVGPPSLPVKGSSIWFPSTWLLCVVGWWGWMTFVSAAPAMPQSAGNCVILSHWFFVVQLGKYHDPLYFLN